MKCGFCKGPIGELRIDGFAATFCSPSCYKADGERRGATDFSRSVRRAIAERTKRKTLLERIAHGLGSLFAICIVGGLCWIVGGAFVWAVLRVFLGLRNAINAL